MFDVEFRKNINNNIKNIMLLHDNINFSIFFDNNSKNIKLILISNNLLNDISCNNKFYSFSYNDIILLLNNEKLFKTDKYNTFIKQLFIALNNGNEKYHHTLNKYNINIVIKSESKNNKINKKYWK